MVRTLFDKVAFAHMAEGEVLEVLTDFIPIRHAISLLIRELGYAYELVETDRPDFRFFIQKI